MAGLNSSFISTYGWLLWDVPAPLLTTDYCARAETRLIEQFEKKENINKYLCALIESFQELEFVFGDLLSLRTISNAAGTQLDGIGDLVGVERQGLTDNQYRTIIRFQIGINFSNGEPETLIALTKFVTEGTTVNIVEAFPALCRLFTDGNTVSADTIPILELSAPAGVRLELYSTGGSTQLFAVAPDPGDVDPDTQGFSEPNYLPDAGKGGTVLEKFA